MGLVENLVGLDVAAINEVHLCGIIWRSIAFRDASILREKPTDGAQTLCELGTRLCEQGKVSKCDVDVRIWSGRDRHDDQVVALEQPI